MVFYYRLYWVMIDIWGNNETYVLKQNVSALIRFQCTSPTISSLIFIISLKAGETHMHQWTGSFFVQAMACRLFGSKTIAETNTELLSFEVISSDFNSLAPIDTIWRHRTWSTLIQALLSEVLWHSPGGSFSGNTREIYHWQIWVWKLLNLRLPLHLPWG